MGEVRGRVALVTGSTLGIGREVARRLAGEGARVVVTGRDEGPGGEAVFVAGDIEEADGTARLVEEAVGILGRVDILVNNGGTSPDVEAGPKPIASSLVERRA